MPWKATQYLPYREQSDRTQRQIYVEHVQGLQERLEVDDLEWIDVWAKKFTERTGFNVRGDDVVADSYSTYFTFEKIPLAQAVKNLQLGDKYPLIAGLTDHSAHVTAQEYVDYESGTTITNCCISPQQALDKETDRELQEFEGKLDDMLERACEELHSVRGRAFRKSIEGAHEKLMASDTLYFVPGSKINIPDPR